MLGSGWAEVACWQCWAVAGRCTGCTTMHADYAGQSPTLCLSICSPWTARKTKCHWLACAGMMTHPCTRSAGRSERTMGPTCSICWTFIANTGTGCPPSSGRAQRRSTLTSQMVGVWLGGRAGRAAASWPFHLPFATLYSSAADAGVLDMGIHPAAWL